MSTPGRSTPPLFLQANLEQICVGHVRRIPGRYTSPDMKQQLERLSVWPRKSSICTMHKMNVQITKPLQRRQSRLWHQILTDLVNINHAPDPVQCLTALISHSRWVHPFTFIIFTYRDKFKTWILGYKKKTPCFTGGRTSQVGSVGLDFFFLNFWWQKVP